MRTRPLRKLRLAIIGPGFIASVHMCARRTEHGARKRNQT